MSCSRLTQAQHPGRVGLVFSLNCINFIIGIKPHTWYLGKQSTLDTPGSVCLMQQTLGIVNVAMTRLNPVQTAILVVFTFTLVFLVINPGNQVISVPSNPLDGCVYVYLDMGTNVGVQIRNGNP